jgi:hypothetical protein
VDDLVVQLSGDDGLFSRIVLFSARGPRRKPEVKNVFIDWVTPKSGTEIVGPPIDGYFLSTVTGVQIARLMQLIATGPAIFNVEVTPYITPNTHYQCKLQQFRYARAITHFCQSFRLTSVKTSGSSTPPVFGVKVEYIRYERQVAYREMIWSSRTFLKSKDFIPVCASVNPLVLIPHLCEDNKLEEFVNELLIRYNQSCLPGIAEGGSPDVTFSAFTDLQYIIRTLSGVPPAIVSRQAPFYCNIDNRLSHYYPRVSYWEGPDSCLTDRACIDYPFYAGLGEPGITVIDSLSQINIFGVAEVPPESSLEAFVKSCFENRFPQPDVRFHPKKILMDILIDTDQRIRRVVEGLTLKMAAARPEPA